jgi:hypothetical protein
MQHVEQSMFYAMKDGENITEAEMRAILGRTWLGVGCSVGKQLRRIGDPVVAARCRGGSPYADSASPERG